MASQAKLAYFDYFYYDKALEIARKDKDLLGKLSQIAEARYRVGKAMQQDVLKSQTEISLLLQKITVLEQQRSMAEARLNTVMSRPPESPLPPAADVTLAPTPKPLPELYEMAEKNSPMLQREQRMIERNQIAVAMAEKEYRPDLSVGFMYQQRPDMPDMKGATFTINVPVFYRGKQRQALRGAQEEVIAAQKGKEDRLNEVRFEMKQSYLSAKAAKNLADLYAKAVVPQASLALESSMSAYQVGSSDFLTVYSNFSTLLNYEMDYYRQVADYNMAMAMMESLVGVELASPAIGAQPQQSYPTSPASAIPAQHAKNDARTPMTAISGEYSGGEEMNSKKNIFRILALVAVVAISLALVFGRQLMAQHDHSKVTSATAATVDSSGRKVLYWYDAMNQQHTYNKPGKAPDGMDLVPKYGDQAPPKAASAKPAGGERKILYWYDPMHPAYKSDKPGTAPDCGMDLVPKYEGEAGEETAEGTVNVTPSKQQLMGVRTATVEQKPLVRDIRTTAQVVPDETRIAHIHVKVPGYVDKVYVDFVGQLVRKGQPVFTLYSPDLVATQHEYLIAKLGERTLGGVPYQEVSQGAQSLLRSARERLKLWDISDEQIRKLDETGEVSKTLTIYSPITGFVVDRKVFPQISVTPDMDLYVVSDLSNDLGECRYLRV